MRKMLIFLVLFGVWLLLSGVYKPLTVFFGVCSVVLVVYILGSMNRVDGHQIKFHLNFFRTIKYLMWLLVEIIKSNVAVTKILLSRRIEINQKFLTIPFSQKTDLAQVIYANSITLTPGTVTVETEDKTLWVHVLNETTGTNDDLLRMDEQVARIENL